MNNIDAQIEQIATANRDASDFASLPREVWATQRLEEARALPSHADDGCPAMVVLPSEDVLDLLGALANEGLEDHPVIGNLTSRIHALVSVQFGDEVLPSLAIMEC
jgi:hypothetical protein